MVFCEDRTFFPESSPLYGWIVDGANAFPQGCLFHPFKVVLKDVF
jgi:hypothetical protein